MNEYDLIIIGGGPGGYRGAALAAKEGMRVLLVEKEALGGTCLNWGCIPTKTLLHTAKQYRSFMEMQSRGIEGTPSYIHNTALKWKQTVVQMLTNGIAGLLKKHKVHVIEAKAYIQKLGPDKNIVQIKEKTYTSTYVIIASGVESYIPPISGIETTCPLTSKEILLLDEIPKELMIIGAGFIGVEFAALFSQLGSTVKVFESMPEILPRADVECAALLREILTEKYGIEFYVNTEITSLESTKANYKDSEGKKQTYNFDTLLISTGRKTKLDAFEKLGLAISKTGIVVDETMQTNIPTVYAIGDIVGKLQLAHVAYRMAEVAIDTMQKRHAVMRYKAIPSVVYTSPEFASCGLTSEEAYKQNRNIVTASLPITMSGRVIAEQGANAKGICKIIADKRSGEVLGMHFIGPMVSEVISTAAVVIEAGLTVQELAEVVFPHPTVGEIMHDVSRILLDILKSTAADTQG